MRWQHGQMVQGAPGFQNHQSPATGASETGLPTLPHRRLQPPDAAGHRLTIRAARHPHRLQTPEGAGLRGPVHAGRNRALLHRTELRRRARGQVRVSEAPADQGGDGGAQRRDRGQAPSQLPARGARERHAGQGKSAHLHR